MKLEIYMKSGNVIKIGNIKTWSAKYRGDEITALSIESGFSIGLINSRRLIVGSIALVQIEAIVESK